MTISKPFSIVMILVLLSGLVLSGCTRVEGAEATAVPPTSTSAPAATATLEPSATATSVPTATETPVPPTATPDLKATADAEATAKAEALAAKLEPDLKTYGVDPEAGHLVWSQDKEVELEVTSYYEDKNKFIDDAGSVADFVIQSDVKWNTSGALSLCGITYHAQDDLNGKMNRFMMMRLQYDPGWTIWRWNYNKFDYFVSGGWASSGDILDKNSDTNVVALVVQGINTDVYINHEKQRRVEDTQLKDGLLAFSAYQESGKTNCKFKNTWVWEFDKK